MPSNLILKTNPKTNLLSKSISTKKTKGLFMQNNTVGTFVSNSNLTSKLKSPMMSSTQNKSFFKNGVNISSSYK